MDIPVPFPTLSRLGDESEKMDEHPAFHSRTHSSPTTPNFLLPNEPSSRHSRYHTRQALDLASSPSTSPLSSPVSLKSRHMSFTSTGAGSPRRVPSLNTPPLTPSSSFNSSTHDTASDFTPTTPEPVSPIRWGPSTARKGSVAVSAISGLPGYLTPSSIRSRSISSSDSGVDVVTSNLRGIELGGSPASDVTPRMDKAFNLVSYANSGDDAEESLSRNLFDRFFRNREDAMPTRFVLVRNIPPEAPESLLRTAFKITGEVKGIFIRFKESYGIVILAYFDLRVAAAAVGKLQGKSFRELCFGQESGYDVEDEREKRVEATLINPAQLGGNIDQSELVVEANATFFVTLHDSFTDTDSIKRILRSFGELASLEVVNSDEQTFRVEYYDLRCAHTAYKQLYGRPIFNSRLTLRSECNSASTGRDRLPLRHSVDISSPLKTNLPLPDEGVDYRVRPRSISHGEGRGQQATRRHSTRDTDDPFVQHATAAAPLYFDGVEKTPNLGRSTLGRSNSMGPGDRQTPRMHLESSLGLISPPPMSYSQPFPEGQFFQHHQPQPFAQQFQAPSASLPHHVPHPTAYTSHPLVPTPLSAIHSVAPVPFMYHSSPPPPEAFIPMRADGFAHAGSEPWMYAPHPHSVPFSPAHATPGGLEYYAPSPSPYPSTSQRIYGGPRHVDASRSEAFTFGSFEHQSSHDTRRTPASLRSLHTKNLARLSSAPSPGHQGAGGDSPENHEKNQLDLEKIESGLDTRTTVMIKNIPNKMSDKDLLDFIARVCPRRIDFLYLRMDFQNGCNVGYAFVNFITVQDLLHFASTQLGVKWNMYSSEKVLQMSYANYQGKEALVEKFKNSCIMDERESWRPKIFWSSGLDQGLPEPFPPPTHLRRKERSAHNRGALFVPGPGSRYSPCASRDGDGFGKDSPKFTRAI
ncbi:unnamed protein product [Somion occarium]|uniref:RRM domain-containing protein n=1 Tax=Somion occarium TaxID=3059160 RepID=A0ABP1DK92_9APHY